MVERPARLLGGNGIALDGELVAARADVDAKLLLKAGKVLVELAIKRAGQLVVVEGQSDMRHVRGPGGQRLQFGSAQTSLLKGVPSMREVCTFSVMS